MSSSVPAADQSPEELDAALAQMEQRALGRNRVPLVELPLARLLEHHARQRVREAARRMGRAAEHKRLVLLALTDRDVPAEVYIASIRAKHEYRAAARELEVSKRRAGIAFRVLERAVYHSGSASAREAALRVVAEVRCAQPSPRLAVAPGGHGYRRGTG